MNEERIKELLSNEEYVKGLFELGSYEKASEKLSEDGIVISPEELKKAMALAKKKAAGELSDEELEEIAGGMDIVFWSTIGIFLTGAGIFYGAEQICESC